MYKKKKMQYCDSYISLNPAETPSMTVVGHSFLLLKEKLATPAWHKNRGSFSFRSSLAGWNSYVEKSTGSLDARRRNKVNCAKESAGTAGVRMHFPHLQRGRTQLVENPFVHPLTLSTTLNQSYLKTRNEIKSSCILEGRHSLARLSLLSRTKWELYP